MRTIVPAGNDGQAGPGYGSIAVPGGAIDAVTVGAADGRLAAPTVRVHVRAGLRVLYEADVPLGGAPTETVTADVVLVDRRTAAGGIARLFSEDGVSSVAGSAVLLPRAALSDDTVEEATSAGALSVLVDGPLPAGAFSLDVPAGVPVVGLAQGVVAEIEGDARGGDPRDGGHRQRRGGEPRSRWLDRVVLVARPRSRRHAEARSRRSGRLRADVGAGPWRRRRGAVRDDQRHERRRGGDGRRRCGARAGAAVAGRRSCSLHGLLVGSAQRADLDPTASGAGLVDLRAAVQQELLAEPALLSFGAVSGPFGAERTILVTNASTRRLSVTVGSNAIAPKGVEITIDPQRFRLRPGRTATVVVRADTGELSEVAGVATGELVLGLETRRRCTSRGPSPCLLASTSFRG